MLSDVCMDPAHRAWNGNRTSSHLQGPGYKYTYSSARNSKAMGLAAVNSPAQTPTPEATGLPPTTVSHVL